MKAKFYLLFFFLLFFFGSVHAKNFFVGIAGASGSGKTVLSKHLAQMVGEKNVLILSVDNYYKVKAELSKKLPINYDNPETIDVDLLIEHLRLLKAGKSIPEYHYDFYSQDRTMLPSIIQPKPIILVEGFLVLHFPQIRELMDLKIFVDVDQDIQLLRLIDRDQKTRNKNLASIISEYQWRVKPGTEEWVIPSKKQADLILPYNKPNPEGEKLIAARLKEMLNFTKKPE